jgi:two-component system, OmpR family, response regulator
MARQQKGPARVLIVGGEGRRREVLAAAVQSGGWRPVLCATVDAAEMLLGFWHYGVVLCEDVLPDGDFRSVMALVEHLAPHTPLIVVSRRDDWESYIAALAVGATDYLAFPPYPGEVERSLANAVRLPAMARAA